MKLSSEKEHLVLDNQRLVYYLVKRLEIDPKSSDYEDIVSIGTIGLIKAAITFDSSKKIMFHTYAAKCIKNEIYMYYRKANKYANDISIDEPIGNEEITLGDTIEHFESDFVEEIVSRELFIQSVNIIFNCLEKKMKIAMFYRLGEISTVDIAKKMNLSQSYVSRIVMKASKKIQEVINHQEHYKEVFTMTTVGEEYRISFSSKDISNFNKIFATLLKNLTSTKKLPNFKVNCNRERIIIQMSAQPEAFSFIAEIIQEIDDFCMAFASDKNTLPAEKTISQEIRSDVNDESNDTDKETLIKKTIIEGTASVSKELDTVAETETEYKVERGSKIKQVRDYMLSMTSFSVKDLKRHFPNLTAATINNAVYLAKSKGIITATGRGEYVVNKN